MVKVREKGVSEWMGRGTDTSGVEAGSNAPYSGPFGSPRHNPELPLTLVTGALHSARTWHIKVTFLTHEPCGFLTLDNLPANHLF